MAYGLNLGQLAGRAQIDAAVAPYRRVLGLVRNRALGSAMSPSSRNPGIDESPEHAPDQPLPQGPGGAPESGGFLSDIGAIAIGAFLAFGLNPSLTVLAVLAYRTVSYWRLVLAADGSGRGSYLRLRRAVAGWRSDSTHTPGVPGARAGYQSTVSRPPPTVNPGDANHAART